MTVAPSRPVARAGDAHPGRRRRHQILVEALASGDAAFATEAMREHVRSSQQDAIARLIPYFELKQNRGTRCGHYLCSAGTSTAELRCTTRACTLGS